jgi:hypothetical protein
LSAYQTYLTAFALATDLPRALPARLRRVLGIVGDAARFAEGLGGGERGRAGGGAGEDPGGRAGGGRGGGSLHSALNS